MINIGSGWQSTKKAYNIDYNFAIYGIIEGVPEITVNTCENGTITADKTTATSGETVTLTVAPADGYKLKAITGVTVTKVNDTTYTFTMPNENVTISAEFEKIPYTVTIGTLTNGTITTDKATATSGETVTLTVSPADGYKLKAITGVTATKENDTTYTFTMPNENVTISAEFEKITYTIATNTGEGFETSPSGNITAYKYENKTITITAKTGYELTSIKVDGLEKISTIASGDSVTFSNITSDHEIIITAEKIPYVITIDSNENVTITPDAPINVVYGDNKEITIIAKDGYKLTKVKVDGVEQTLPLTDDKITLTNIQKNMTIIVECELLYEEKTITKTEEDTTVSVKGNFNGTPTLVITKIESGNEGYNSLITLVKDDKVVLGSYDVSITGGTYEGELTLTFTVGKQYEGETITIYHKLESGEVETKTAKVVDGKVTITVNELSPFMLVADKTEEKDTTPKTGNTTNIIMIVASIMTISTLGVIVIKTKRA